jgi:hypothetical protein
MKWIVLLLLVVAVALTAAVVWLAWPEPVTAAEVLKATGAKYWRYRIPDTYKPSSTIGIEVTTLEGIHRSGGGSGFQPGEMLKVFLIPNDDKSRFRWAIIGENVTISSSIPNPFVTDQSYSYPLVGSLLRNDVLMQAVHSSDNNAPPTIRISISAD